MRMLNVNSALISKAALTAVAVAVAATSLFPIQSLAAFSSLAPSRMPAQARASDSYLFGRSTREGLGDPAQSKSDRYNRQNWEIFGEGFRPLTQDYGSAQPTPLRILIKDDIIASPITNTFVTTLSQEKPNLMRLYKLTNQEYNRLATIAFGIMGKETKFGTSLKYAFKEANQAPFHTSIPVLPQLPPVPLTLPSPIRMSKLAKKKLGDAGAAVANLDASKFIAIDTWQVAANSRGLTQIKAIPQAISRFYCVNVNQLDNPRLAAIATLGFLAESLRITKNRVRNQNLSYVNSENIWDYVLYVYFGSIRQLTEPQFGLRRVQVNPIAAQSSIDQISTYLRWVYYGGQEPNFLPKFRIEYVQINETATPNRNMYIQAVKQYIRALALFESEGTPLSSARNNACRLPQP